MWCSLTQRLTHLDRWRFTDPLVLCFLLFIAPLGGHFIAWTLAVQTQSFTSRKLWTNAAVIKRVHFLLPLIEVSLRGQWGDRRTRNKSSVLTLACTKSLKWSSSCDCNPPNIYITYIMIYNVSPGLPTALILLTGWCTSVTLRSNNLLANLSFSRSMSRHPHQHWCVLLALVCPLKIRPVTSSRHHPLVSLSAH